MSTLWAVADLHAAVPANSGIVDSMLYPPHPRDWLIVAGDVAERTDMVISILAELNRRYHTVIWAPGNHELFNRSSDKVKGRGRYDELVAGCRRIGVLTPEDPYPRFAGHTIVPMFTLYDYSWRPAGTTKAEALAAAEERGAVMTDEFAIAPFVDIAIWCRDRLGYTLKRLSSVTGPTVLINHWPLVQECLEPLALPQLSLWCGTRHTQDWPQRFNTRHVVYGHLHIPRTTIVSGVAHHEVSLGYPREWNASLNERVENELWPFPVLTEEDK